MFKKIAFIGAGQMAEAIIAGLVQNESLIQKQNIIITNKQNKARLEELQNTYGVTPIQDKEQVIEGADIIVLSMKPKDAENALSEVKELISEDQLIISVLAGIEATRLAAMIGKNVPVVRTMPNTSAMVGASATGISKGEYATDEHIEQTKALFQTIGTTVVVPEEEMHAVTSISGSGPAYFYYMVEAMQDAAKEVGLERELATELILQTIIGVGQMLCETKEDPAILRKNITSPGGTTQAGLETLRDEHFKEAIIHCVKAARDRSIEMSK